MKILNAIIKALPVAVDERAAQNVRFSRARALSRQPYFSRALVAFIISNAHTHTHKQLV